MHKTVFIASLAATCVVFSLLWGIGPAHAISFIQSSTGPSYAVTWDMQSTTLDWCDSTDGCTTSETGISFSGSGAEALDSTDRMSFVATDNNNMEYDQGTIEFFFYGHAGDAQTNSSLLCWGTDYQDFSLRRNSADDSLSFWAGTDQGQFSSIGTDLWDDTKNRIHVTWDDAANERNLYINGSYAATDTGSYSASAPTGSNFYLCTSNDASTQCEGIMSDFTLWHTVNVPTVPDTRVEWDMTSSGLDKYSGGDGGTTNETGVSYSAAGAELLDSTDKLYITASDGRNIEHSQGTIEFEFEGDNNAASTFNALFEYSDQWDDFTLIRSGGSDTELDFTIGGVEGVFSGVPDMWADTKRIIRVTWDDAANERKLYVDGSLEGTVTTSFSFPTPGNSNLALCSSNNDDGYQCEGTMSNLKIWRVVYPP